MRPCKYFQQGHCKKGAQCDHAHVMQGDHQPYTRPERKRGVDADRWDKIENFDRPIKRGPQRDFNENPPQNQNSYQQNFQQNPQYRDQQQQSRSQGGYQQQQFGQQQDFQNHQQNRGPNQQFRQPHQQQQQYGNSQPYKQQNRSNFQPQQQQQQFSNQQPFQRNKQKIQHYNDMNFITCFSQHEFLKFLPIIEIGSSCQLPLVSTNSITFYQIQPNSQQFIDSLVTNQLPLPQQLIISNSWLQKYPGDVILSVAFKTSEKSPTISLLLYTSLLTNSSLNFTIEDVSNGQILGIHMDMQNQHLYAFCIDKIIRIFKYDETQKKFILAHSFQTTEKIQSFCPIEGTSNGFLVGGENGMIFSLLNGQIDYLNGNLANKNIIQIESDIQQKRYLLLVWLDNMQSEVYTLSDGPTFEGPVYEFKKQITKLMPFQNLQNQNILLIGNRYGTLVSLQEQKLEMQQTAVMSLEGTAQLTFKYAKYNEHPYFDKNQSERPRRKPICDLMCYDYRNQNQVSFKYLFIGLLSDGNIPNIEIFQFI